MKNVTLYVLMVLITFTACKKHELPIEDSKEPVFYLNCEIEGARHMMEAGNNDYFMNTSWSIDSSNVYVVRGDLAQSTNSSNKSVGVSVLFNYSFPTNGIIPIDSILKLGSHLLNHQQNFATKQTVSFKPMKSIESAASYQWYCTDGMLEVKSGNDYSFTADCEIGKTYSVVLKYNDGLGGCISTHTNVFKAGSNLQTRIIAKRDTSSPELQYIFSYIQPYPGSLISCTWKFEDGSTSTTKSPTRLFNPGTSIVSLMLIDLNTKDTCRSYYQLNATDNMVCDANFEATFEPIVNTTIFATATVLLTDLDGTIFSSRQAIQPASSNFEIVSVSEYKPNSNGEPTKNIEVKFNCLVQNGQKQKALMNAKGFLAISYKP